MKQIIYFFLSILIFSSTRLFGHDELRILQNRIKQVDNFYSYFVQKINNIDGKTIELGTGELWIKKPNLFHCHMLTPEEVFLISDGNTCWFYVPDIKQVTAHCLKKIITDNIFLRLLLNDNFSEYKHYNIIQKDNWFYLQSISVDHTQLKECHIKITDRGIIDQFIIIEPNGQSIDYYLSRQNTKSINLNKFYFSVPKNVHLDDQR